MLKQQQQQKEEEEEESIGENNEEDEESNEVEVKDEENAEEAENSNQNKENIQSVNDNLNSVYLEELNYWQCVCLSLEDWDNMHKKYKASKKKVDQEIAKLIEQSYLPEMPALFQRAVR
jgi:hypothetical protein